MATKKRKYTPKPQAPDVVSFAPGVSVDELDTASDAIALVVDAMPDGSRVIYNKASGIWDVFRGNGSSQHASAHALGQAFLRLGASRGIGPDGKPAELDPAGNVIPPEPVDDTPADQIVVEPASSVLSQS